MKDVLHRQFVGMHELRKNLTKLLDGLRTDGREVVITRQGKPSAVIMDLERYLEVQQAFAEFSRPDYVASLLAARDEIRQGMGISAEEVFRKKGS
ncbi:MAG TPA: type II toxin-antitoxin system Phd/YefM family antitoxin [Chloroflexota bacterium]|nr:type II toxin-antitoxin system Phd/YefM family antitoxin [Chloroflexota bacterium]